MIPQRIIEEIQARVDIVEIASGYFPLKKTGRNFKARCPFHSEKTPSFIISPQKQIFHCFGCGQGGGVFQFLMQMDKVSFPEAVEMLAKRVGIPVTYQKSKDFSTKSICYEAAEVASFFYHNTLKAKEQAPVLHYLKKRGIAEKTIDTFRLGYAPGRNSLINYMRKKGFSLDALDKASLVTAVSQGYRDIFSERILFPIFDIRDRVIGFGGRLLKDSQAAPKYINSGESLIYSKRNALFGLNLAKKEIIKEKQVYVTEGYLDMITPFMRGVKNIVASLGTSLTQEQIKLLNRFCSKVILVFDSDSAGQTAMLRTIDLLLENQIQAKIVDLPKGEDPDSIVRKKGKDCFLALIKEPLDFFDYKLKVLSKQFNPEDIEDKSRIAESMLTTISKLDDEVKKYQYLAKLAQELKVKEEAVISEYKRRFSLRPDLSGRIKRHPEESQRVGRAPSLTEKILIKAMFNQPKILSLVRKNFKAEHFGNPLVRKAVLFLLKQHPDESEKGDRKSLANITDPLVGGFISRIILEDDIPQDQNSLKESLAKLRKKYIQEEKETLKKKIKKADSEGNKEELERLIAQYNQITEGV